MTAIRTLADRLIYLCATFGALALLFEVGVILVDVIGRSLGRPLFGSQDLVTMAMAILVFGGMAICDRMGGHIAVDLFEKNFPPRMNWAVDIIAALIGAVIFTAIAWAVYDSAKLSVMLNLSTNLLRLPKWWFQWALVGFSLITALGMLLRAIEMSVTGLDVRNTSEDPE
ncbi:MAG: TRAP transporter small permease [Qingshengfaniella sp.]